MTKWILIGLTSLLMISCMRHAKPDWVQKNTNAYLHKEVFYGVGSVSGVKNKPLAQLAADNKARAEIAKILEAYAEALVRDYIASLSQDDLKGLNARQNVALVLKTYAALAVSSVTITKSWTDRTDGTVYSLAKLKLNAFKSEVAGANEVGPDLRKFIKKNAKGSFDRFKSKQEAGGKLY